MILSTRTRRLPAWLLCFLLGSHLLCVPGAFAQSSQTSVPSPGTAGVGVRFGATHFSGDVRNAQDFSGASTPFHAGGDLFYHLRLAQAVRGENAVRIGLELAAGYRFLHAGHPSYEFRTNAYPVSTSVTIEFNSEAFIRPFLAVGVGAIPYELGIQHNTLKDKRAGQAIAPESGVAFWVPLRIGLRAALSAALDLHMTLERSATLSDRLDGIVTRDLSWLNDNFEMVSFGFTYYFLGNKSADPYGTRVLEPTITAPPPPDSPRVEADGDGDGISDVDEEITYHTDPKKSDTDGDSLTDGQEVKRFRTNPMLSDSDGDGLVDNEEIRLGSNPQNRDTDGDGLADGGDKCPTVEGPFSNLGCPYPTDKGELVFQKLGDILILENIEFEPGKATLLVKSNPTLDKVASSLKANPNVSIEIRGHTDSTGDYQQNVSLSIRRAESVKQYLVTAGIDAARISTEGLGPTMPIGSNATPEGRQRNRRIEFRIVKFGE